MSASFVRMFKPQFAPLVESGKMCMSIDDWPLSAWDAEGFARADGFTSLSEMAEWFQNTHGLPFEGIVIYWQNAQIHTSPQSKD